MRGGKRKRVAIQCLELEVGCRVGIAHEANDIAFTLSAHFGCREKSHRDEQNRSEEFRDSRMEFPIHVPSLADHIRCSKEIGRRESASRMLVTLAKLQGGHGAAHAKFAASLVSPVPLYFAACG